MYRLLAVLIVVGLISLMPTLVMAQDTGKAPDTSKAADAKPTKVPGLKWYEFNTTMAFVMTWALLGVIFWQVMMIRSGLEKISKEGGSGTT